MPSLGTTFVAALLIGSSAAAVGAAMASPAGDAPAPVNDGGSATAPPSRDALVRSGLQTEDTTGSLGKADRPGGETGIATGAKPASGGGTARPAVAVAKPASHPKADKMDDLEDGVVVPAAPPPSQDPLDALAPDPLDAGAAVAKPAVGPRLDPHRSGPGPAAGSEPDALKPDALKPEETKLDGSKPGAVPAGNGGVDAAAPAQPLSPLEAAVKAALDRRDAQPLKPGHVGEARKERAAIAFFYAARSFAPLWSADGKPVAAVEGVIARLKLAGDDGLAVTDVPSNVVTQGSVEAVAASDLAMTEAVVAYARQASGSRVDPRQISPLIGHLPQLADPGEVLDRVVAAADKGGDVLVALNPSDPRYLALRAQLAALRPAPKPVRAPSATEAIPPGPTLRLGMHDARVRLLRTRFALDISLDADMDPDLYDAELAEAVAGFQRDNGLAASGTLNRRTLAALNGEGADATGSAAASPRLKGTILANMEMWRWMPRDLGADRIEVNVPDYEVTVFHDGAPVDQHRVVVGKQDTPTPLFSNAMKYLIVNPYWNVPQSIIKKEMLPKGGGSLSYLEGRGYEVGWHGGAATVKQLPGPKNALGQIKFLFPNDYSVYLHDTPSKALFAASKRAFSHGCVRVDKPFAFAESVLNDNPGGRHWSEEKLRDMVGDKERYVNLPAPLPIHIEYFTATVDNGKVRLREDIYGYAHAVASALGQDSEPAAPVVAVKEPKPRDRPTAVAERVRRRGVEEETAMAAPPPPAQPRTFWGAIFDPR